MFANRATKIPDKTSVAVMATVALNNFLRWNSSNSYTRMGSVDKIQSNESLFQGDWPGNSSKITNYI